MRRGKLVCWQTRRGKTLRGNLSVGASLGSLLLLLAVGCSSGSGGGTPDPLHLHPMKIAEHQFSVEIAADPDSRAVGLMYRKSLPENQGMLFLFNQPRLQSFYMKNCEIDLEIAYLDDEGKIVDLLPMKAPPSGYSGPYKRYRSTEPVRYALEMNAGWFPSRGIGVGTVVEGFRGPSGIRIR